MINFVISHNQFSPNVRYHAPHPNASFKYGYINLKHLKGYKLDVTPLATYSVNNRSLCVKECLKTKGECKSINTRQIANGFECDVLGHNIYTSGDKLVKNSTNVHSFIAVSDCEIVFFREFCSFTLSDKFSAG